MLEHRGAHDGAITRHLVGTSTDRRNAENNRIVAMIDRFDLEHRLWAFVGSIVAGPLAEGPFLLAIVVVQKTFEHNLGIGWKRQPRDFSPHEFHGLAAHSTHDVILAHAVGMFGSSHEEKKRIAS